MTLKIKEATPVIQQFVMRWGELGAKWGINRTMAQIHALLYLSSEPLNAEQIAEKLFIARSNVSTSLRELQSWRLVKVIHLNEDRRDYYQSVGDVWQLFWVILEERKKREVDPAMEAISAILFEFEKDMDPYTKGRLTELHQFLLQMNEFFEEIKKAPNHEVSNLISSSRKIPKINQVPKFSEEPEFPKEIERKDFIFYDGECEACQNLAKRVEPVFSKEGFKFAPLQSEEAIEHLQLSDEDRLSQLWVVKDDRKIGGSDALIYLAGKVWWGRPLTFLGEFQWFRTLFAKMYKHFSKHRHILGASDSGRFF